MDHNTESIWRACSDQLRVYIVKRMPEASLADDILQEVFIKIHENIHSIKDDTKICIWVYQIAKNTINDYYRKQKIQLSDIEVIPEEELSAIDDVESQTAENQIEQIASGLQKMINSLPEKYAQALKMVELQGLSQTQLAKELNISVSGAKSRVQRGRQMLKDALMNCCHYEFDKYGTIISYHPKSCCCCSK
ncbi:MAG: rpoE [Bacteroidetes bacterium]|nr:rpoE [Bacteroidota bacterium]